MEDIKFEIKSIITERNLKGMYTVEVIALAKKPLCFRVLATGDLLNDKNKFRKLLQREYATQLLHEKTYTPPIQIGETI